MEKFLLPKGISQGKDTKQFDIVTQVPKHVKANVKAGNFSKIDGKFGWERVQKGSQH